MDRVLGHGQLISTEDRWLVHVDPVTKQFVCALELLISVQVRPILNRVLVQVVNPNTLVRPALAHKRLAPALISDKGSFNWFTIAIDGHLHLETFIVDEEVIVNLDVRVSDDGEALVLVSHPVNETVEILEPAFVKSEVSTLVSVLDVHP
jgi:hypothetical protein